MPKRVKSSGGKGGWGGERGGWDHRLCQPRHHVARVNLKGFNSYSFNENVVRTPPEP